MTQHLKLKKGALRGCIWLRPSEPVLMWTTGAFAIFGLEVAAAPPTLDSLIGRFGVHDRAAVESLLRRALDRGETDVLEAVACRGDGTTHLVGMATECVLGPDGAVDAVCLVIRDQTEAARAERMTRLIVDHLPGMISYWDDELICRFANAAYGEWFGRTPPQMIGIHLLELLGEARFNPIEGHIRGVLQGERQVFETALTKPTGEPGHILAHFVPDHDGRGRVPGYYVLIADVTELKHTEEQLRQSNALLEEARAEAEAAAAVKRDFLSNMSHELRSPLTSVIGFAEVLEARAGLPVEERRYVERIHDASRALLTTINDILDFSKLEAGQVEFEYRPVDPFELGRRTLELFELQLDRKGLAVRFEHENLPPFVRMDDARVRQILFNLLGNAAKFTVSGSIRLRAHYDRDRQRLRYEVVDTGPGIPADRMSRLFLRFAQVDASTARNFGGTGLGLSICRGLAEAMGGEIGVDSALGQGSRFWFELPCPIARRPGVRQSIRQQAAASALTGARLLVVDDNAANRELAGMICRSFGMIVMDAADGAEGAAIAAREPLDAILLDVRMPGLSGPAAARLIRAEPGPNRSTPIIAFTAEFDRDREAEWAGLFQGVLAKPMSAADVLAALTKVCVGRSPVLTEQ